MLTELSIRNIVLIEQCTLSFDRGLCVLTGETGAGKSILLDALGLILGMRAEARLIRHGTEQASVSARFDVSANDAAKAVLDELGLETADELTIRRNLSADGKTRCFINDTAVGVGALKSIGETLVEIHGQHEGGGLLDPSTHRRILDAYGVLQQQVSTVSKAYAQWKLASDALAQARATIDAALREQDYLQHMQKELGALKPEPGEEETLASERTRMMQGEKLAETLKDALSELTTGKGALSMVMGAQRILARSSLNSNEQFNAAIASLDKAADALGEAEGAIETLTTQSHYDPLKLERLEERLFALRGLARKHHCTVDELSALLASVTQKLSTLANQQHELGALEKALAEARDVYLKAAEKLGVSRRKAAKQLEKAVAGELDSLKMAATQFAIALETLPEERWGEHGTDNVQFTAATNKGATLSPLHKIASGGELSRFMLAMKVALASVKSTPTLIFDEIDTGTGGAVADAIGARLARLGETHQVLVVTHLPQVAARGASHLFVQKAEKSGKTFTQVELLSVKARKEEVARMLAGAEVTVEARKAAEKLLQAAV